MKLPLTFPERLFQWLCGGLSFVVYSLALTRNIGPGLGLALLGGGWLLIYLVLAGVVRYADHRARWHTCHAALTSSAGHLMDGWDCCHCRFAERHVEFARRKSSAAIPCEVDTCPRCGHVCCDPELLPALVKLWRPRRGRTCDRFGRRYTFADFLGAATAANSEHALAEGLDLADEARKLATNAAELQALLPLALELEGLWRDRHPKGSRGDELSFSIRQRLNLEVRRDPEVGS